MKIAECMDDAQRYWDMGLHSTAWAKRIPDLGNDVTVAPQWITGGLLVTVAWGVTRARLAEVVQAMADFLGRQPDEVSGKASPYATDSANIDAHWNNEPLPHRYRGHEMGKVTVHVYCSSTRGCKLIEEVVPLPPPSEPGGTTMKIKRLHPECVAALKGLEA